MTKKTSKADLSFNAQIKECRDNNIMTYVPIQNKELPLSLPNFNIFIRNMINILYNHLKLVSLSS